MLFKFLFIFYAILIYDMLKYDFGYCIKKMSKQKIIELYNCSYYEAWMNLIVIDFDCFCGWLTTDWIP